MASESLGGGLPEGFNNGGGGDIIADHFLDKKPTEVEKLEAAKIIIEKNTELPFLRKLLKKPVRINVGSLGMGTQRAIFDGLSRIESSDIEDMLPLKLKCYDEILVDPRVLERTQEVIAGRSR